MYVTEYFVNYSNDITQHFWGNAIKLGFTKLQQVSLKLLSCISFASTLYLRISNMLLKSLYQVFKPSLKILQKFCDLILATL